MESDPFALDQQALEEKLKALQKHFQRLRQLRAATDAGADGSGSGGDLAGISADLLQDELQWLTGEIQRGVKSLSWEVKDLGETLAAMRQQGAGAAQPTGADQGRARFLGNARSLLAAIEAELAEPGSSSGAADHMQQQQQQQQQQPVVSDTELLLATDTVELEAAATASPGNSRGGGLLDRAWALAKRHRAPLACVGCLLFLAFVLWVFYEAVLLHGSRQECICTANSSTAAAVTAATTTATTATTSANTTTASAAVSTQSTTIAKP